MVFTRIPAWQMTCIIVFVCVSSIITNGGAAPADTLKTIAPTTAPAMVTSPAYGYIEINSIPQGADVELHGIHKITPARFTVEIVPHPYHQYTITKIGYYYYANVILENPEPGGVIRGGGTLVPLYGLLNVTSTPSGADIFLDGYYRGSTPRSFENSIDRPFHNISISKPGYNPFKSDLNTTIIVGETVFINAILLPTSTIHTPSGTPSFSPTTVTTVTTSSVTTLTPTTGTTLTPTSVTTSVSDTSVTADPSSLALNTVVTTITPLAGTTVPGMMKISSDPPGADILIDNAYFGITPLNISSVQAGKHVVILRLKGYDDWQANVDLSAGQIMPIEGVLSQAHSTSTTTVAFPAVLVLLSLGILLLVLKNNR